MKETWQERLKRFEAAPPASVWNRVENALEQDPASVAERLQAWEAAPPAGLWNRIEQQLDATAAPVEEVPVVALPRRRRTFFAYAAAAAVLGAVLIGSALLLNRKPEDVSIAHTAQPVAPPQQSNPGSPDTVTQPAQEADNESSVASATPANDSYDSPATDNNAAPAHSARRQPDYGAAGTRNSAFAAATPAVAHRPAAATVIDEDRYLVRAYNNGSTVRYSKKVSAVVDCAEHSTGFTQSLCKVSIGAVQERIASSMSTDFGGLIERLQDLEKTR
ncbi:MAG: hypothetical protein EOO08_10410 [Chitinophagaceae bacterium]|nr:MAG: hypothetical protein EOO08_10410 [Chitinophagaceae bacterium]